MQISVYATETYKICRYYLSLNVLFLTFVLLIVKLTMTNLWCKPRKVQFYYRAQAMPLFSKHNNLSLILNTINNKTSHYYPDS